MQLFNSKQKLLLGSLLVLFLTASTTARAGLDGYEIYLNDKLILKQYVNQPLNLESLGLTQANINDKLTIHYSQCNVPDKLGKNRSITVKDYKGNTVKQWRFTDAKDGRTGMVIAVKELLQLDKVNSIGKFSLYYTAEGHESAQLLTHVRIHARSTSFYHKPNSSIAVIKAMPDFTFLHPLSL
jgi:hypothetical protein